MNKAFYILCDGDLQQDFATLAEAKKVQKENKFGYWTDNSYIQVCIHHDDYDPETNSVAYHWEAA